MIQELEQCSRANEIFRDIVLARCYSRLYWFCALPFILIHFYTLTGNIVLSIEAVKLTRKK